MKRKFWSLLVRSFIKNLQFRSELIVYFLTSMLPFIILFFVWGKLFSGGGDLRGFSFHDIITYYILVYIIGGLTSTYFESWRSREIREGKIDLLLTKPIHYFALTLFYDLGSNVAYFLLTLPILVLFIFGLLATTGLSLPLPNLFQITQFLALVLVGYSFEFLIAITSVILTFWFEGAEGLQHFKWIFISLLSGSMIPLVFMPSWLEAATRLLPLKYMYAIPISIIQGNYNLTIGDGLFIAASLMFLVIFSLTLWKKAQYQYASAGG